MHTRMHVCTLLYVFAYACMHVCIHLWSQTCIMHVHACICTYVHTSPIMCVCKCTTIPMHAKRPLGKLLSSLLHRIGQLEDARGSEMLLGFYHAAPRARGWIRIARVLWNNRKFLWSQSYITRTWGCGMLQCSLIVPISGYSHRGLNNALIS